MKVNLNKEGGKSGIHIKPENKGKFNALKKRTGKTTEELTHSKNPLTRKRAIFAENAKHFKHKDGGSIEFVNNLIDKFQKGGKKTLVTLPKTKPDMETNSTGVTDNRGYHFQENKTLTFPNNGLPLIQRILQTTPYINREINRYPTQQADTIYSGVGLNGQNFNYSSKGNTPEFRAVNGLFNRSVETKGEGGEINKNIKQVEVVAKRPTTNYFYKSPADSIEYIGANGPVRTNTVDFVNTYRQAYDNSINTGASKFQAIDKLYHDKNVIRLGIDSKKYPSQVFDMNMNSVDKTKLNPRKKLNYLPIIP